MVSVASWMEKWLLVSYLQVRDQFPGAIVSLKDVWYHLISAGFELFICISGITFWTNTVGPDWFKMVMEREHTQQLTSKPFDSLACVIILALVFQCRHKIVELKCELYTIILLQKSEALLFVPNLWQLKGIYHLGIPSLIEKVAVSQPSVTDKYHNEDKGLLLLVHIDKVVCKMDDTGCLKHQAIKVYSRPI
ncbi:hypothetical protein EDB83DRAFT_2316745 [Lactarius deliciosus]|nr:hypothetical protein EDB83DRAFT_2316745 [Lactarius deliciosus]